MRKISIFILILIGLTSGCSRNNGKQQPVSEKTVKTVDTVELEKNIKKDIEKILNSKSPEFKKKRQLKNKIRDILKKNRPDFTAMEIEKLLHLISDNIISGRDILNEYTFQERAYNISGKILDKKGNILNKITIKLIKRGIDFFDILKVKKYMTVSHATGIFKFNDIPEGDYRIELDDDIYYLESPLTINIPDSISELTLTASKGSFIKGIVIDAFSEGVSKAEVSVISEDLLYFSQGKKSREVVSGIDGRFNLGPLKPGNYKITALKENLITRSHIIANTRDDEEIVIALYRGGGVKGRILSENSKKPAANRIINLTLSDFESYSTITGSSGDFYFSVLPAGAYIMKISDESNNKIMSQSINVRANNLLDCGDIYIKTKTCIMGRVVERDKRPVSECKIEIYRNDNGQKIIAGTAESDADGFFSVKGLKYGKKYSIECSNEWGIGALDNIVSEEEEYISEINEIVLKKMCGISGTIKNIERIDYKSLKLRLFRSKKDNEFKSSGKYLYRTAGINKSGAYSISKIEPGYYYIAGFTGKSLVTEPYKIRLTEGVIKKNIILKAARGKTIKGTVFFSDGKIAEGVKITAVQSEHNGSAIKITGMVDKYGKFVLTGLDNTAYDISLKGDNFEEYKLKNIIPGTRNLTITLQLTVEIILSMEYRTPPVKKRKIKFTIYEVFPGNKIEFIPKKELYFDSKDTEFIIYLKNGKYQGKVEIEKIKTVRSDIFTVDSKSKKKKVSFIIDFSSDLYGKVLNIVDKKPVKGAYVSRVPLSKEEIAKGYIGFTDNVKRTDEYGSFIFKDLINGIQRFYIYSPFFEDKVVSLDINTNIRQEETILLKPAARIKGVIYNEEGISSENEIIELVLSNTGETVKTAVSDKNGKFEFNGLSPGDYIVRKKNIMYSAEMDLNSKNINLLRSQTAEVELGTVKPDKLVYGKVLMNNRPVSSVIVSMTEVLNESGSFGTAGGAKYFSKNTSSDGYYEIESVPPGKYRLNVSKRNLLGSSWNRYVEVPGSGILKYNIKLPGSKIRGSIVDSSALKKISEVSVEIVMIKNYLPEDKYDIMLKYPLSYTYSDDKGDFEFIYLKPGVYRIKFRKFGYKIKTIDNISLNEDETKNLKIKLVK